MISTILEKCLVELGKPSPDLSYIRGMIEVLLASQPQPTRAVTSVPIVMPPITDEAAILDARARANLDSIKASTRIE